jgi:SWI/SNF-related matrix-associated actin-dependent regulator 1 of chromatin subfamily A
MKEGVNLYPYQSIGVNFINSGKYVLIGDVMGLGKTIQAIAVMEHRELSVVVCPAMLRYTWQREIKKFTGLSSAIVKGAKHDFTKVPKVLIVSYEGLKHIPFDLKPDMVVFDECHYIKNPKAIRSKKCHEFIWEVRPDYCVGLSGTPIKNNIGEFYSILKMLSYCPTNSNGVPLAEKSHYAFCLKFSVPVTRTISVRKKDSESKRRMEITEFKGLRNKELLKTYLKGKYIRRTSKGVLNLPPLTGKLVNLSEKDSVTSKKLLEAWNEWLETGKMGTHIMQIKVAAAMEKTPQTSKYLINMVEQGEQVVIFSDHVAPVEAIAKTMLSSDITCGVITGSVSQKIRDRTIEKFQNGKLQVLCCTIKAASVGLTLTAARNLVFNDLSWVPADLEQARKRIHRIGQEHPCVVHYMSQGSLDSDIQEKIIEKSKLMREVL